jgi:hypothetical protein
LQTIRDAELTPGRLGGLQLIAEAPSISSIAQLGNCKRTWVAVKTARDYEYYLGELDMRPTHL